MPHTGSYQGFNAGFGGGQGSNAGFGGGGGTDFNDLLKLLGQSQGGKSQGLFGLGDVGTGGLFSAGGALFGGLADLLGGKSDAEKRSTETFDLARNRLGQSPFDPDQYLAELQRSLGPQFNQQAEGINRRLGLDSGVAQGELARGQQSTLSSFLLQARQRADEATFRNDQFLLSLMGSLGG